jgi:hypothetical protein
MIAGAVFCLSGLYLMIISSQPDSGAAKFELFGQKFEANSRGIIVFLVGAAFLASPLYLPKLVTGQSSANNSSSVQSPLAVTPQLDPKGQAILPSNGVTLVPSAAEEVEKNNSMQSANMLTLGGLVTANLSEDDEEDWYAINTGQVQAKEVEIKLRGVYDYMCAKYSVLNAAKQVQGEGYFCGRDKTTAIFELTQGVLYARIIYSGQAGGYELAVESR